MISLGTFITKTDARLPKNIVIHEKIMEIPTVEEVDLWREKYLEERETAEPERRVVIDSLLSQYAIRREQIVQEDTNLEPIQALLKGLDIPRKENRAIKYYRVKKVLAALIKDNPDYLRGSYDNLELDSMLEDYEVEAWQNSHPGGITDAESSKILDYFSDEKSKQHYEEAIMLLDNRLKTIAYKELLTQEDYLIQSLNSDDYDTVTDAIEKLGDIRSEKAISPLISFLDDPDYAVQTNAREALRTIGDIARPKLAEAREQGLIQNTDHIDILLEGYIPKVAAKPVEEPAEKAPYVPPGLPQPGTEVDFWRDAANEVQRVRIDGYIGQTAYLTTLKNNREFVIGISNVNERIRIAEEKLREEAIKKEEEAKRGVVRVLAGKISFEGAEYSFDPINKPILTIGRGTNNDIRTTDPSSSRSHARIFYENGAWYVENLGTYGTRVNGLIIKKYKLSEGDKIEIGEHFIWITDLSEQAITDKATIEKAEKARNLLKGGKIDEAMLLVQEDAVRNYLRGSDTAVEMASILRTMALDALNDKRAIEAAADLLLKENYDLETLQQAKKEVRQYLINPLQKYGPEASIPYFQGLGENLQHVEFVVSKQSSVFDHMGLALTLLSLLAKEKVNTNLDVSKGKFIEKVLEEAIRERTLGYPERITSEQWVSEGYRPPKYAATSRIRKEAKDLGIKELEEAPELADLGMLFRKVQTKGGYLTRQELLELERLSQTVVDKLTIAVNEKRITEKQFDIVPRDALDISDVGFHTKKLPDKVLFDNIPGLTRNILQRFRGSGAQVIPFDDRYMLYDDNWGMTMAGAPVEKEVYDAFLAWRALEGFKQTTDEAVLNRKADEIKTFLSRFNKGFDGNRATSLQLLDLTFELLKNTPDSVLNNPELKALRLYTGRIGAARGSQYEDNEVRMFASACNAAKKDYLYLLAHELGHPIHDALESGHYKGNDVLYESWKIIRQAKAFL